MQRKLTTELKELLKTSNPKFNLYWGATQMGSVLQGLLAP